ncbi:sigma-54 dependent transcriptional regulator [Roseateles sp.]|uniref:sigma-54-dependent transcriptional regulator n=1 Tax=Roseateles sp. TaxID=1971397 RepID=UPI0025FFD1D1|nr:sigma-54 dependent transcriptional regulator [Roseateles sp.]MBV8034619.1 sigma-54-dependent Fis family transcriptional regulator [Roseateles sp.]
MTTATLPRLLVVDDEPDLRTLYELTLLREGYEIDSAGSVADALAQLQAATYSAVITDMRLPDGSGLELLRWLEQAGRPEKAVVITAFGSAENAVEALKAGAYDYLTKPVDLRQFRIVVGSALGRVAPPELAPVAAAQKPAVAPASALRLVGESPAMRAVRSLIDKVGRSMAPVLVQGESGTGKELVARAIHDHGARAGQRFVAVNCGAIPENLLEAEFFGYRKGAFTGANEDREGFFQAADGGTLFLDEIGDLPLAMQSKLLRVIQERSVRPVGATSESPVNVRILSATHKDLAAEVAAGRFRQDLFYRLNVIQIRVPPLRERLEDLGLIGARVLARIAQDAGVSPTPRLTNGALQTLSRYAFPGNVRELENLLHRALALAGGEWIDTDDLGLPEALLDEDRSESQFAALEAPLAVEPGGEGLLLQEELPSDLARYLDEVERGILLRALELHRFNRTAAAASLGLSLRQIRYRMARLAISAGDC